MNSLTGLSGLLREIWVTFDGAAFYILLGIVVAGLIQTFVDSEQLARRLGKPGLRSVLLAALFGIPLPLCSCGVIPTAISLRKNGASKGAVLSFLISTPESGLNSIAMSYAMLDPLLTIFRPISALLTAVVAGVAENIFGQKEAAAPPPSGVCPRCHTLGPLSHVQARLGPRLLEGMKYAFVDLLGDLAGWLAIGIIVGGMISYWTPPNFAEHFLGSDFKAMLVMLAVGIPLYICASASTPVAAALIAKGMSPGVALVFLLAGPATNLAGILAVGKFLGKRSAVIYLLSIAVCAVLLGLALNGIYAVWHINIQTVVGHAHDMLPPAVSAAASVILLLSMIYALWKPKIKSVLV
ncbi:MAG: SO_0444 family Cu/Zn efflux transporter [Candidatus Omnitrophica bacterium]|nr:SO_0444 family Cu/Zn efflux transporter [Candidatus Omnitrophota bacterium]